MHGASFTSNANKDTTNSPYTCTKPPFDAKGQSWQRHYPASKLSNRQVLLLFSSPWLQPLLLLLVVGR